MKTNFSRFGKSAVSVVLSALMLLSTVLVNAETVNVNADSVSEAVVSDSAALEKSVDVSADVLSADNNSVSIDASELVAASSDKSVESSKSASAADVVSEETAAVTDKSVSNSKKSEKVTPNSSGSSSYKVYFKNTYNWNNINLYAWYVDDNNNVTKKNADWPGSNIWYDASNTDVIYTTISDEYNRIQFNNGDNIYDKTGDLKFDKHCENKIVDPVASAWEMYNASDYSSSSSGELDGKYFIYGTTSEPYNFINSLPIQSNGSRYYVEFNPVVGQNYYFALSGSKLYTNLYTQGENGNNGNWKITYNNSDFYAETNRHNNVNGTDYYFSLFSVNNKAIKTVRIYLNREYSKNYEIVGNPTDTSGVTVYAKSGTIRESTEFTDKYSELAATTIGYTNNGDNLTVDDSQWKYNGGTDSRLKIATVERNKEITVTTTLKPAYRGKYYVKAFCVNGASYNIIDETEAESHKSTGKYSFTYTISDDETGPIEITPIYYYFTNGKPEDYITFSVEDFTGDVKALWGNTLACYAYYVGSDDNSDADSITKPALGGYPGQPMVYINGSYYMQIPKTIANNAEIEGITLNNYIWDDIHSEKVQGLTGDLKTKITNKENANCQTYDYDDFIALSKLGAGEDNPINRIVFNFKYRTYNNTITKTHTSGTSDDGYTNKGDWDIGNPANTNTNSNDLSFVTNKQNKEGTSELDTVKSGNGWDALVDYYDYPVDLFARRLADSEDNYLTEDDVLGAADGDKVYVVSNGYEAYYNGSDNVAQKYVGQYATRWYVYKYEDSKYKFIGALPPSAFLSGLTSSAPTDKVTHSKINANTDISESNFLEYLGDNKSKNQSGLSTWSDYQKIYEQCAGLPVVISYESNIYSAGRYVSIDNHVTQNPGYRSDGRWYYSLRSNPEIWAKAKIQIVDSTGKIVPITTTTIEDGNEVTTTSDFDTFNENSHTGARTGANAYFTNSIGINDGDVLTGTNSMTEVTATQSDTNYFKFTADDYSVGTDENGDECYYIFRGWYVNYGSTSYSPVNNPSELYNVDGQKPMDSNVTVVARYQEVDPDEILTVSHKLLSSFNDSTSYNYDKNAPTAHNGTGDPTVTVEIIKDNGDGTTTTVYTRTGTDVAVDAVTLARYKDSEDYTIKVTLNTDSTTNTSVVGVYRKTTTTVDEEETSEYLKSNTKDENNKALNEVGDKDTLGKVGDQVTVTTTGSTKTSQLVYTYSLKSLYDSETSSLDYATDLQTDALTITHELYNSDKATKNEESPAVGNGKITNLGVIVEIVDKDGNSINPATGDVISDADTDGDSKTSRSVSLTANVLKKYIADGYQIKVTLPASVAENDNSKVDAVYRQDSKTETKYTESAKESAEDSTSSDYTGWNVTGEYGDSTVTGAPKTYYYNISDLFDDEDNLKTNEIKFFSDANRYVTFSFKYYDRKMSDTSQPLDIDKGATTISQTIPVTNATNLEEAIGKSIIELRLASTNIAERKINNNIDKYVFWASQEQAVSGIANEKRPGSTNNYLTNAYHTDYYGRQAVIKNDGDTEATDNKDYFKEVSSANKEEKWVTYIGASNPDIEESAAKKDPTKVKEVVIWGFNTPQTYEMTFKTETLVHDDDAKLYFATEAKSDFKALPFYYNERVGEAKGKGDIVDGVSDHLSAYGISQNQEGVIVYADKEVKVDGATKYFDGWYERVDGKYIKVSSDPVYGNRVTKAAKLIAGYKDAETVVKGITVTANDVEKYVSGETEYVRYTTVLNSYGFDDSDHNFESAAVVYVRLASGVTFTGTVSKLLDYSTGSGTLKDAIIENLNEADSTGNRQAATVNVTITRVNSDAKTVVYAYDVVPTDTGANTANDETPITNSKIRFTNKNRVQFSMNLPVSAVEENGSCSNLLVFAAVKYKDDSATYSNTFTGTDAADGSVYIASDNYVVYQNGAAVK